MNEREKKLIFILVGAAFIIANLFVYTSYDTALQQKKTELAKGESELQFKLAELEEASTHIDEVNWLNENMPSEGTHATIRAELVTSTEQSAAKHRITLKKRPSPLREDPDEEGDFRSAIVKVLANSRDQELYRWLVELQDPTKARSITRLRITPQRDDATRIDCEMEITQWFTPLSEEDQNAEETTATNE
jgi:hypothetical protein